MAKPTVPVTQELLYEKLLSPRAVSPLYAEGGFPPTLPDVNLRHTLFGRTDHATESAPLATVNLMESLVLEHLDSAIARFNSCSCDRCRCDIAAYALNHLPPRYVVTNSQHLDELRSAIPVQTVMDALIKAVIQVRSKPRH